MTGCATTMRAAARRAAIAALTVLLAAHAGPWAQAAAPLPEAGGPLRESIVMGEASIDGRPLSVRSVASRARAAETVAAQVHRWRLRPAVPVALAVRDGWLIASRMADEGFETLQMQDLPDGTSRGFRTIWPRAALAVGGAVAASAPAPADAAALTSAPASAAAGIASLLPPGARLLRVMESRDGGRRAVTAASSIGVGPQPALRMALERLARAGWSAEGAPGRFAASREGPGGDPAIAWMRRPGQVLLLTAASRPGGAALMVHWMEDGR